jgi:hypothetical protein
MMIVRLVAVITGFLQLAAADARSSTMYCAL